MFFKVWDKKSKQMLKWIHKIEIDHDKGLWTCDISKDKDSTIVTIVAPDPQYVLLHYNISKGLYDGDIIKLQGSDLELVYSLGNDEFMPLQQDIEQLDHVAISQSIKEKKYDIVGNYCEKKDV
jgi:hypothetical protein